MNGGKYTYKGDKNRKKSSSPEIAFIRNDINIYDCVFHHCITLNKPYDAIIFHLA